MVGIQLVESRWPQLIALSVIVIWVAGCSTVPGGLDGDYALAIDTSPPAQVEGPPQLLRGDDGLLYIAGEFEQTPVAGQVVFGRYDGEWPLQEMEPPALFAGEVIEVFSEEVARIHGLFEFPDVEYDELSVELADGRGDEPMGKGLGAVESVESDEEATRVGLPLGDESGIQDGDLYGLFQGYGPGDSSSMAQLTRRFVSICEVDEIESEHSRCTVRRGHPDHPAGPDIEEADTAIFLEPRFSAEPRMGRVKLSSLEDEQLFDRIHDQLGKYFERYPDGAVAVESFGKSVDARDADFHRWNRRARTNDPATLVGLSLVDHGGEQHLFVNYTGLSTAVGPGMVAAPPEGGVDMGPPDELTDEQLKGLGAMLMGAILVYRGQTAEALAHLHSALGDPGLSGKWRWHTRDQYAMRWGALDRFEEAFWLIHEDEALARANEDEQAYYNALGTRVRLHDFVDQHQRAYETAAKYLDSRVDDTSTAGYLSAQAMYGEMALHVDEIGKAEQVVEELIERCPDGCSGDLIALLAGIYWAATEKAPDLQDQIVSVMVDVGQQGERTTLASARMFEGWTFMRDRELEWSLVAFREARRLFDNQDSSYGTARAEFYLALTQIAREEPQDAFDRALEALEYMTEVGDYRSMVRIYERLAQLYVEIDMSRPPQPFFGAATRVLRAGLQAQLSTGDYGKAAEAGFGYGHFLFQIGNVDEARFTLQRSVWHGLRVARFDMVSLAHLFLALIARTQGDMELFEQEIERAQMMADIADDPHIDELIDSVLSSPEDREDPTQLL